VSGVRPEIIPGFLPQRFALAIDGGGRNIRFVGDGCRYRLAAVELQQLMTYPPYQLVHRTVSAKLLGRRFQAGIALMMVHSFSPKDTGFAECAQFAALFGIDAEIGTVKRASFATGWCCFRAA